MLSLGRRLTAPALRPPRPPEHAGWRNLMARAPRMLSRIWRIAVAGVLIAGLVATAGWALGRARFGVSDEDALARMERELGQQFSTSASNLDRLVSRVAAERSGIGSAPRSQGAVRRLFDALD